MTIEQLGQATKAKYPQYQNVSDADLGKKILEKYPQYQSRITTDKQLTPAQQKVSGFLESTPGKIMSGVAKGGYQVLKDTMDTSEMLLKEKAKQDLSHIIPGGVDTLNFLKDKLMQSGGQQAVDYLSKHLGIDLSKVKLPDKPIADTIQSSIEKNKGIPEGTLLEGNNPVEKVSKGVTEILAMLAPIGESGAAESLATKGLKSATAKGEVAADKFVDMIIRGSKNVDTATAKDAILSMGEDAFKGVKDFKGLSKVFNGFIEKKSSQLTKILSEDPNLYSGNDLKVAEKVGDKVVRTNYVDLALRHLQEYYNKTIDPSGLERIKQLMVKAKTEGLSQVEINNLAKEYGSKLTNNFFKNNGELLKGVSSKASESVRSGLKETSRSLYKIWNPGSKLPESLDDITSALIKTKDAVDVMAEQARIAASKIKDKNLLQKGVSKTGEIIGTVANTVDGGLLKGIVRKAIGGGLGSENMSVLEIEKKLPSMLKDIFKTTQGKNFNVQLLKAIIDSTKK